MVNHRPDDPGMIRFSILCLILFLFLMSMAGCRPAQDTTPMVQTSLPTTAVPTESSRTETSGITAAPAVSIAEPTKAPTPFPSFSTSVNTSRDDFEYVEENGKIKITKYKGSVLDVVLPENIDGKPVTVIASEAFMQQNIKSVVLSDHITTLERTSFGWCKELVYIMIPASVTSIDQDAFFDCNMITWFDIDSQNPAYSSQNGILFNRNQTELLRFPMGKTDCEYTVPASVTKIAAHAFMFCYTIEKINIPDSVTIIGDNAFQQCYSLTSLKIPRNVREIGTWAFHGTRNMLKIEVDENNACFTDIDGVIFTKDMTELIQFPTGRKDSSYVIPDGVKIIREVAFSILPEISSITIPASVSEIGQFAFRACPKLNEAIFLGNAPTKTGSLIFAENATDFTIYYKSGSKGWSNPWQDIPAKVR